MIKNKTNKNCFSLSKNLILVILGSFIISLIRNTANISSSDIMGALPESCLLGDDGKPIPTPVCEHVRGDFLSRSQHITLHKFC